MSRDERRRTPSDQDAPPERAPIGFDKRGPFTQGRAFGPTTINRALKAGFYVMAQLYDDDDTTRAWAVDSARWHDGALECHGLNGWRIVTHVWTLESVKGLKL